MAEHNGINGSSYTVMFCSCKITAHWSVSLFPDYPWLQDASHTSNSGITL